MSIKSLSRMLLVMGLTLIVFAIFKDVSYGGVYNLHKASQQSNQLILGGFIFLAGIVAMVASRPKGGDEIDAQGTAPPQAVQRPPIQPPQPEFASELDISSPSYQLFLTRQFSIEKNSTLEKYVIGDDVFVTLEESLREADHRYQAKLSTIKAEEEKVRREKEELEQKLLTEKVQQAEREEKNRAEQKRLEAELRPIREARVRKIVLIGGPLLLIVLIILGYLRTAENARLAAIEMKEAALAKVEHDRRMPLLRSMFSSSKLFGLSLGERNEQRLQGLLGYRAWHTDNLYTVKCDEDCNSLPDFPALAPAVRFVRFEYCKIYDVEPNIDNFELVKVIISYNNPNEARADFYELKRDNYVNSWNLPSGITQHIDLNSLELSLERRQGDKNTCGN